MWTQASPGKLDAGKPVTLTWDNGEGLEFRRIISIDDQYLLTVESQVINKRQRPGHALSLRAHPPPRHAGDARLLHPARRPDRRDGRAGPAGVHLQADRGQEERLVQGRPTPGSASPTSTGPRPLLPDPKATVQAKYSFEAAGTQKTYQTDYLGDAVTVAAGATASSTSRLFAGAKEAAIVGINFDPSARADTTSSSASTASTC